MAKYMIRWTESDTPKELEVNGHTDPVSAAFTAGIEVEDATNAKFDSWSIISE